MDTPKCTRCGHPVGEMSKICHHCGLLLPQDTTAEIQCATARMPPFSQVSKTPFEGESDGQKLVNFLDKLFERRP